MGHAKNPSDGAVMLRARHKQTMEMSVNVPEYPSWSYYPRNEHAPEWVVGFVNVVRSSQTQLDTRSAPGAQAGLTSDEVLRVMRPGLETLGYSVESGKRAAEKISRPVLFGDEGKPAVKYELDAFHEGLGIAVEVEAGRGAANNADYRDIIRTSLILDAEYLALAMPLNYRYRSGGHRHVTHAYLNSRGRLDAIYSSQRLQLPFRGVLLLGY